MNEPSPHSTEGLQNKSSITCGAWNGTAWPSKELHRVKGLRERASDWGTKSQIGWQDTKTHELPENRGMPRLGSTGQQTWGNNTKECEVVIRRWILASIWIGEGSLDEIPIFRSHKERKSEEYYPRRAQWLLHESPVPYWISLLLPT